MTTSVSISSAFTALCLGLISCASPDASQPTVRSLDAPKHPSERHEVAPSPNSFEMGLVAAQAIYEAQANGSLTERNEVPKNDGSSTMDPYPTGQLSFNSASIPD